MDKLEILKNLNELNLDKKEIIIISGASLVVHDIILNTNDIDLACSDKYYSTINWKVKKGFLGEEIKCYDCFEISNNLYENANNNYDLINGYKFMNLEECLKLKKICNRKKDREIIKKLEKILKGSD